jgi:hypothetical protein
MRNSFRLSLIAIAQILLLCSCATTSPQDRSGSSNAVSKPAAGGVSNGHYETTSAQSLEKDGLLISYSLRVIPDNECNLIRLTLVFRNQQDSGRTVSPKVSLTDSTGKMIRAYSRAQFGKFSAQLAKKRSGGAGKPDLNAELRGQLTSVNWLKSGYKMSPRGIAIGELVFRCTDLKAPLKLTVNSNRQEFVFTTKSRLSVGRKK